MTNTNVFKRRLRTLVIVAMSACAWGKEPVKPVVTAQFQQAEVTVEAINPDTREVSLRGPHGPLSVVVSPDVKNLDKVRVGDKLLVSYYQGIAVQIAKGGTKVSAPVGSTFTYPGGGAQPGVGAGASITTAVTIEDVDEGTHTVAFRRLDGSVHIIAVQAPNMQQFIRTLKRGDSVEVTYTESVAVKLVPAQG